MLISLSIQNFALIEQLSIKFSNGFSTITGETGAGKSILLGALGLVLGKRADLSSLKHKDEKCIIEAHFDISRYDIRSFFEANDLDYEAISVLRREILPSGKSRAFINDSLVNLQELQDLGFFLIDIHSQHQTQELSEEQVQFQIIDAIAGNQDLVVNFKKQLQALKQNNQTLIALESALRVAIKEQDYNAFLLEELRAAKLIAGTQETLESTYAQLNSAAFIRASLGKAIAISDDESSGALTNLKEIKGFLQKVAPFSSDYQNLFERLNSVVIELDDIVEEMNQLADKCIEDPNQLDFINAQLQSIYSLQKKHQVSTIESLMQIQSELENKLISLSEIEKQITVTEDQITKIKLELDEMAGVLRSNRNKAIPILSEKLIKILILLGMQNVAFNIKIVPTNDFVSNGKDELQFLFSANKGSDFGSLKKVASGGEMSRIMLATKAILAQYSKLPTIIFDEIDTGVSGEIANKMAEIMKRMSADMQVFAITHLPQIAAKGDAHFKVFKSVIGEQTISELKLLTQEERIVEIAEMLSGKAISDSAINHAKALLN